MTVVRTRLVAAAMGTLLTAAVVAVPHGAQAAQTVDQEQLTQNAPFGLSNSASWAQVFTAGKSGPLGHIDVRIDREAGTTGPLTVEIHNVTANAPGATVLASVEVPAAAITEAGGGVVPFVSIPFPTAPTVVAGTKYAFAVHTNGGAGGWRVGNSTTDLYSGGAAFGALTSPPAVADWTVQTFDMSFRTFVTTPDFDPNCDNDGVKAGYNLIKGTNGDDELKGTDGKDLIYGFGGNDTILGRGGNDLICAGDGNDTVNGGDGKDVVFGGAGNDRLVGAGGNDRLFGGEGNDTLIGRNGNDSLYGENGNDVLRGNAGDDKLRGGNGADVLRGGTGDDDVVGGRGLDSVS